MPDREKVIKAIEICYTAGHNCTECPLFNEDECNNMLMRDVIALLREQDPVKPEFDSFDGNVGRWRCGNCQVSLGAVRPPYCWHCGKAVKWDADD